jgi:PII-like signaling protein
MVAKKMWTLAIRIKKNDELHGKRLYKALLDFMMDAGISGATVVNAVDGFGRRGRSTLHIEGISVNYPLIIEVVDEQAKLEPLLPQIRRMVDDNGIVTLHEVDLL